MQNYDLIIFSDWFLPASKAGGPISSILNLVNAFESKLKILIVTGDRDLGDAQAFEGIETEKIIPFNQSVDVMYWNTSRLKLKQIQSLIKESKAKTVYLNSMFSFNFSFIPCRAALKLKNPPRVVLAPRGMLSENAIAIKSKKKSLFIKLFKALKYHQKVHFQATDQNEVDCIKKIFNVGSSLISNFPYINPKPFKEVIKRENELTLITTSRISQEKNTLGIYKALSIVSSRYKITHVLIGPSEKKDYWQLCKKEIAQLGTHIQTNYLGPLKKDLMLNHLQSAHAFILLTLGENFGHSIFEALALGKPLIISNLTPWLGLEEKGIGWSLPLSNEEQIAQAIETLAAMDQESYSSMGRKAFDFAENYIYEGSLEQKYLDLFRLNKE